MFKEVMKVKWAVQGGQVVTTQPVTVNGKHGFYVVTQSEDLSIAEYIANRHNFNLLAAKILGEPQMS